MTSPTSGNSLPPDDLLAAHRDLRDRLVAAGRLIPTGVDGVYGRDAAVDAVIAGVQRLVHEAGAGENPTVVSFPPVIPKASFDKIGYLRNFPQLVGPVYSFAGGAAEHQAVVDRLDNGERYDDLLSQTDIALTPACCYPVYPSLAGRLAGTGRVLELCGYCFRHEPSVDPMRMQSFRQHEHVRVGPPDDVLEWRHRWPERALQLLGDLGLDVISDVANDPFFGRAGRLMKMSQREQELKYEFLVNVYGDGDRTACASINYHQGHFGHLFDITTDDGEPAHSSCIGFGLERIGVALFSQHGMELGAWPAAVSGALGI